MEGLGEIFKERLPLDGPLLNPEELILKVEPGDLSPGLRARSLRDRNLRWDLSLPEELAKICVSSRVKLEPSPRLRELGSGSRGSGWRRWSRWRHQKRHSPGQRPTRACADPYNRTRGTSRDGSS